MKKLIILLVILVLSMIMAVISSCTTTKYVPMKEVVIDTVYRQSDSIIRYRWITNTKDSTVIHDSTVINRDASGNVTGTDRWHSRDRYVYKSDSLDHYKELYSKLLKSKVREVPKPYPVTKEVNRLYWWQKALMWVGVITILCIIAISVYKLRKFFFHK